MTGTEFKPGTIGFVDIGGEEVRAVRVNDRGNECWHGVYPDGSLRCLTTENIPARPAVVIDPRDRSTWTRIGQHIGNVVAEPGEDLSAIITAIGDILDDLAHEPTKPAEPTNYLAVVGTRSGKRYWRWAAGTMHTGQPWRLLGAVHADTADDDGNFRWEELAVVEVVSEGVPA